MARQFETSAFAEGVKIGFGLVADVELCLGFNYQKPEPRTWDYPGYPGGPEDVEVMGVDVKVFDVSGNEVQTDLTEAETEKIGELALTELGGIDGREIREVCEKELESYESSWDDR